MRNIIDEANEKPDEEVKELMDGYDLDRDAAENVKKIMDDHGLNEDEAIELQDEL